MRKSVLIGFFVCILALFLVSPCIAYTAPDGEEYTAYWSYTPSFDLSKSISGAYCDYEYIDLLNATNYYIEMDFFYSANSLEGGPDIRWSYDNTVDLVSPTPNTVYLFDWWDYKYITVYQVAQVQIYYNKGSGTATYSATPGVQYKTSNPTKLQWYNNGAWVKEQTYSSADIWITSAYREDQGPIDGIATISEVRIWADNVDLSPIAGFHAAPTSGDEPLEVKFYDDSDYGDYWIWFFGDNWYLEYDADNWQYAAGGPEHTYHEAGSYTVKQCVQNAYGEDWENKTSYITVGEQYGTNITAQFTADPLSGGKPLTVKFYDQSVGDDLNLWRWYFGDDYYTEYDTDNWEYTAGGPEHTYRDSGYFDVTLMVRNSTDEDWEVKTSYIIVYYQGPPNADWFAVPESGPAPLDVSFWDTSSGDPTNFYWDYGDGWWTQYDTDDVMYDAGGTWHTYNSPGTYLVNLTVSSPYGSDSKSDYITVTSPANGTFAITAIDSQTNALIHSAHIEVTGAGETWYDDDFDGTISMDLPLGTNYGITVSSSGYYDQFFQYTLTANKQMTVALVRTGTAEEGYSSIDFIVKESITNNPVRAATVTFDDTWTLTDDYGSAHFTVSNTSGNLEWVVSKTGYYPEQGTVDTSTSQTVQVSLVVQPPPTTLTPTPTPSQPGNVSATPTPDTRTPEEKVNDAASIWINGAEFISGLLFLAVIFGIVDLFGGRRRGRR
jgi:PKD repeat protein